MISIQTLCDDEQSAMHKTLLEALFNFNCFASRQDHIFLKRNQCEGCADTLDACAAVVEGLSSWDSFLEAYSREDKSVVSHWDKAIAVREGKAARTFPSSQLHKLEENAMEMELLLLFLTTQEFASHFNLLASELDQRVISYAELSDVCLGGEKRGEKIQGVLLRPDPFIRATATLTPMQMSIDPKEQMTAIGTEQTFTLLIDNSANAYRRVRIYKKLGFLHEEEAMSKEAEVLPKQAQRLVSFLCEEEQSRRPKEPVASCSLHCTQVSWPVLTGKHIVLNNRCCSTPPASEIGTQASTGSCSNTLESRCVWLAMRFSLSPCVCCPPMLGMIKVCK